MASVPTKMPQGLLSATSVSAKHQQIYARNQEQSRLLDLPPEIRNRIWSFVLGGRTLHISGRNNYIDHRSLASASQITHCICDHDKSDIEEVEDLRAQANTTPPFYIDRHEPCMATLGVRAAGNRLLLELLGVCRQIHEEAALLPFSENVFSFAFLLDVRSFSETILQVQGAAIQRITIVEKTSGDDVRQTWAVDRRDLITKRFGNLRHVTLFVEELQYWSIKRHANDFYEMIRSDIIQAGRLPAEKVLALVALYPSRDPAVDHPIKPDVIRRWEKCIEDKMTREKGRPSSSGVK